MRVALLQTEIAWEEPQANFARLRPWIRSAAAAGVRLLAFPETYSYGFSMDTDKVAEAPDGPSTAFLTEQAKEHGLWLAGSVPIREAPGELPYNTMVLAAPDGALHRYRKIHPFTYGGEDRSYQAGSDYVTVDVEGLRLSLFICYDLRFANVFWDLAEATDAYLVIANWPEPRRVHWTTLLATRAIENQAYVLGANRVGKGGGLVYTGDSRILDPLGRTLAAAAEQETLLIADVEPAMVRKVREELPFLRDRRVSTLA